MKTTLLTLDEAADFLNISRRTLTRYRAREDFPRVITLSSKKVCLIQEELTKWVLKHRKTKK